MHKSKLMRIRANSSLKQPSSIYKTWGVDIDHSLTDSAAMVSYTGDAVGMTACSSDWYTTDLFKDVKPCVMNAGTVLYYLDKNDYTKRADGVTASDITTLGNDVMVEFPKMGYKLSWDGTNTNILHVQVTNNPSADGFCYDAFSKTSVNDCSKMYYGAYQSYIANSLMYSTSGQAPTTMVTLGNARTAARSRGTNYYQNNYGQFKLLQCLYLIFAKNLNSQTAIGRGVSDADVMVNSGVGNSYGFCNENNANKTSGTTPVKFLGIENLWGNCYSWIDGAFTNTNYEVMCANMADVCANDYTLTAFHTNGGNGGITAASNGYMTVPNGSNAAGFTLKTGGATSSTCYPDYQYYSYGCFPISGGCWDYGNTDGIFCMEFNMYHADELANVTSRLVYLAS